jgi:cyclic pyranopterin phosphate synthase
MAEEMTFLPKSKVLSLEEMELVAKAFVQLGVEKIRLTGGEPLVRNGVVDLAKSISKLSGLRELVMTTNGVLLDKYSLPLADAGVSRLNISIDSLRPDRFEKLTRFGCLDDVLRGIQQARRSKFKKLKLNTVVLKGINDDEILDMTGYAVDNGLDISFIEEMPLGHINSHQRQQTQVASLSIRDQIGQHYDLVNSNFQDPASGPSRYLQIADSDTKVGFISPMSNNFCASCNRVRVTAEGLLLLCLGNEHSLDLRALIRDRQNDSDQENLEAVKQSIVESMVRKPERHHFDPNDITITRHMSATGG